MSTVHTATLPPLTAAGAAGFRRAGRLLIASFGVFLLGLIAAIVTGTASGTAQAEAEAAERLGVAVVDLPAEVLASVHAGESPVTGIAVALLLVAAAMLLVGGVRAAVHIVGRSAAGTVAVALAVGSASAWIYVQVASPLYSPALQPFVLPAVIVSTGLGAAALVASVVALRGRGVARRTGIVVGVLGMLVTIGCVVVPPFAPFLLGLVLGVPLARSRPSATM